MTSTLRRGCCTRPVVLHLAEGAETCPHGTVSLSLAGPKLVHAVGSVTCLLIQRGEILWQGSCEIEQAQPELSFTVSLERLRPGLHECHIFVRRPDRGVNAARNPEEQWQHIEQTQLLGLCGDAALEVDSLFGQMLSDVRQYFEHYSAARGLLRAVQSTVQRTMPWLPLPVLRNASVAAGPPNQPPEADDSIGPMYLYAYEHCFAPFLSCWAAAMPEGRLYAEDVTYDSVRQLLEFLIDHSMFNCVVLLTARQPALTLRALQDGFSSVNSLDVSSYLALQALARQATDTAGSGSAEDVSGTSSDCDGSEPASVESASDILQRLAECELQHQLGQAAQQQLLQRQGQQGEEGHQPRAIPQVLPGPAAAAPGVELAGPAPVHPALQAEYGPASAIALPSTSVAGAATMPHSSAQAAPSSPLTSRRPPHGSRGSSSAAAAAEEAAASSFGRWLQSAAAAATGSLPPSSAFNNGSSAAGMAACAGVASGTGGTAATRAAAAAPAQALQHAPQVGASLHASGIVPRFSSSATEGMSSKQQQQQQPVLEACSSSQGCTPCSCPATKDYQSCSSCWRSRGSSTPGAGGWWSLVDRQELWAAAFGYRDAHLEASYGVYKNHSCAALDTTAFIICFGMLCASSLRNFHPGVEDSWAKLLVLAAYGAMFFFPYLVMLLRPMVFLRHRDALVAGGRVVSAFWLLVMALGWLPQPDAWVTAVTKTYSLQLQNSIILPICQQVRLKSKLAMAGAHLLSDFAMFLLAYPAWLALAHSLAVQAGSLLVTLLLDARLRGKFMARYHGPFRAAAHAADGRAQPASSKLKVA